MKNIVFNLKVKGAVSGSDTPHTYGGPAGTFCVRVNKS